MMFINPMLILTAESVIEKSFEHRNPTLFAIGAGMLGVGTVGWAGTKAFVRKESKAKKPMNRTFKTTGGASILVILASLLAGLGFGGGPGTGTGEADASTAAPLPRARRKASSRVRRRPMPRTSSCALQRRRPT